MSEFIITIACAGIASGIIGLFFEDDKEIMKYIRVVFSLCLAASIVPAAYGIIEKTSFSDLQLQYEASDFEEFREKYKGYVIDNAKKELSEELKQEIFDKTGINVHSCNIQFSIEEREDATYVDVAGVIVSANENAESKKRISDCVYAACGVYPEIIPNEKEENI